MALFFIAEVPNLPFMELYRLTIIDAHEASTCIEMDSPVCRPVGMDTVNSWLLFWKEVVLEYVGPGVSRHVPFSPRWVLKSRAEAFFAGK
jgi:hypothetical protein